MSEQYISKDKKGIWYSHLVSSSTGTLSCNILWQECETSHFVKRLCYSTHSSFIKSECQNLCFLSVQMLRKSEGLIMYKFFNYWIYHSN